MCLVLSKSQWGSRHNNWPIVRDRNGRYYGEDAPLPKTRQRVARCPHCWEWVHRHLRPSCGSILIVQFGCHNTTGRVISHHHRCRHLFSCIKVLISLLLGRILWKHMVCLSVLAWRSCQNELLVSIWTVIYEFIDYMNSTIIDYQFYMNSTIKLNSPIQLAFINEFIYYMNSYIIWFQPLESETATATATATTTNLSTAPESQWPPSPSPPLPT
jgi:hypothetical protein